MLLVAVQLFIVKKGVILLPRVAIKKRDYQINDLKYWIKRRMDELGVTQAEMGELLGMTQAAFSLRLKSGDFKFRELLIILDKLEATQNDINQLIKVS